MSDQGEKTCPLCAEEMDLTDQQLKPCKCGYEICVWCWHHIMNMAEKDNVEGRCPACRTPYNKEKIVDKAAQCERLVSELSVEKKVKSKSKGKTADGRKNLSGVRVIQRNLVYIVGLPLNLADEDLLQRKEYFAQYGKVQKVSISRTAAGTIQQFPNNTCSVYITYSKEEEAVRCIQSVHGYTLEGRPLRACFGTTKYCHAWLRSVPCSNPDCLYLHEIGTQEDSFTKDEIISGYTRNRVHMSTGATVDMQNRSGNVLPPPADEFCNSNCPSSGVHSSISSTNNLTIGSDSILESSVWQTPASSVRGSPPNNSSNNSVGLPAAASWGMRASNHQQSQASMTIPNGPSKQKADACGISVAFSTAVANPAKVSILLSDSGKKLDGESAVQRNKSELLDGDQQRMPLHTSAMTVHSVELVVSNQISMPPLKVDASMSMSADVVQSADFTKQSCGISSESNPHVPMESEVRKMCSDVSSLNIDTQGLQCGDTLYKELLSSLNDTKVPSSSKDPVAQRDQSISIIESQFQVAESDKWKVKDDLQSLDIERLRDPEVVGRIDNLPKLAHASNSSRITYPQEALHSSNVNVHSITRDMEPNKFSVPQTYNVPVISDGYVGNRARSFTDLDRNANNFSYMISDESKNMHVGSYSSQLVNHDSSSANHLGESSIISNILSMDFDSWDESLASPQNLAKLLGETDKQQGSQGVSGAKKVQNSNQSRFSFAREEDQASKFEPSLTGFEQTLRNHSFTIGSKENGNYYDGAIGNGFSTFSSRQHGDYTNINSHNSSNRFPVSRAPVSAPPGFSVPSRAPPPGFGSYERMEQTFDVNSGNRLVDNLSFLRNANQSPSTMHIDSTDADIEFIDPAILAVGKGRLAAGLDNSGFDMRSTYPTHMNNYESEARLQLLMQKSLSQQQNPKYVEMGGNFSSRPDNYGMPSRILEQSIANNASQYSQFGIPHSRNQLMSSGNWDGWSEVQSGNNLSVAELLRSERLGIDKYFTGYKDSKYRIPSSGNLYN